MPMTFHEYCLPAFLLHGYQTYVALFPICFNHRKIEVGLFLYDILVLLEIEQTSLSIIIYPILLRSLI